MTDTDKHGFTVKNHKIRKIRLLIRALLTLFVCGYALHRCSISACAADSFQRLTVEQTLALYGTEIPLNYYRASQNDTIDAKAVYIGTTDLFSPRAFIDSLSFKTSSLWSVEKSRLLSADDYGFGGLVYAILPDDSPNTLVTPWLTFQQSSTADHANISCDFPVTFSGISRFVQPVFWTIGSNFRTAQYSTFAYTTSLGLMSGTACRRSSSGSTLAQYGFGQMSLLSDPRPTTWTDVPERYLQNVACLFADLGNPDLSEIFDITGVHYSLNNVYGVPVEGDPTVLDGDNYGYIKPIYDGYIPFLVVGRPALYGYNPPAITTTTAATTRPISGSGQTGAIYTQQTVDLSNLESGVAAIVQQEIYNGDTLDWIGENERRAVDNLAIIIDQLNAIYAKMWSDGEITVDSGLEPPAPEVLQNFVSSALASQGDTTTFALSGIFAPYFGLGAAIAAQDVFAPWLYVGGFVMVFAVVCWFVFYGRKG